MASVFAKGGSVEVAPISIECPFCGTKIVPQYLYVHEVAVSEGKVFAQCPDPSCRNHFILDFYLGQSCYRFKQLLPTAKPLCRELSDIIKELSINFTTIYNEAYAAEQMSLNQICGVGYRKALEFLIKDYIIADLPAESHEKIKQKFLNKCIQDDVNNANIKLVASRAAWLGNDETHYVRKWEDKDVQDLKTLIDLTIRWIESEIETKRLLEAMPSYK